MKKCKYKKWFMCLSFIFLNVHLYSSWIDTFISKFEDGISKKFPWELIDNEFNANENLSQEKNQVVFEKLYNYCVSQFDNMGFFLHIFKKIIKIQDNPLNKSHKEFYINLCTLLNDFVEEKRLGISHALNESEYKVVVIKHHYISAILLGLTKVISKLYKIKNVNIKKKLKEHLLALLLFMTIDSSEYEVQEFNQILNYNYFVEQLSNECLQAKDKLINKNYRIYAYIAGLIASGLLLESSHHIVPFLKKNKKYKKIVRILAVSTGIIGFALLGYKIYTLQNKFS